MLRVNHNPDGAFSISHETLGVVLSVESDGRIKIGANAVLSLGVLTQADLSLAAVTGVDGTANNAASKTDVDARFATIQAALNAILGALRV